MADKSATREMLGILSDNQAERFAAIRYVLYLHNWPRSSDKEIAEFVAFICEDSESNQEVIHELYDVVLFSLPDPHYYHQSRYVAPNNPSGRLYWLRGLEVTREKVCEHWYSAGARIGLDKLRAVRAKYSRRMHLKGLVRWMRRRTSNEEFVQWFEREFSSLRELYEYFSDGEPCLATSVQERAKRSSDRKVAKREAQERRERMNAILQPILANKDFLNSLITDPPDPDTGHTRLDLPEVRKVLHLMSLCYDLPASKQPVSLKALERLRPTLQVIEKRLILERDELDRKREIEERQAQAHEELYKSWKARIGARCRAIVTVFNGVFGLDIDPNSILTGEVSGSYASIYSGGGSLGPDMHLRTGQTLELRLEIRLESRRGTWLELEEGGDEAEWAKAYEAENLLIWHELSHLADGPTLGRLLRSVPEYLALNELDRYQARELVIDAIGLGLAESLYVHPDKRRHLVTPGTRQAMMLRALCVQTQRVLDSVADETTNNLLLRLFVQLDTYRNESEIVSSTLSALTKRLDIMPGSKLKNRGDFKGSDVEAICFDKRRLAYEAVYAKARRLDVLRLRFHPSIQTLDDTGSKSKDEDSEFFIGSN